MIKKRCSSFKMGSYSSASLPFLSFFQSIDNTSGRLPVPGLAEKRPSVVRGIRPAGLLDILLVNPLFR